MLGNRNKQKASPMTEKLSNAEQWCRMIGKQVSLLFLSQHLGYMVRTTSDKQILRTFQGQITVFNDPVWLL